MIHALLSHHNYSKLPIYIPWTQFLLIKLIFLKLFWLQLHPKHKMFLWWTDKLAGGSLVGLFAVAIAHALVVAVMISAGHISGGHLNPAVTLGLLAGGHITVFRSILYWIDQLLASAAACFLLQYLTGGLVSQMILFKLLYI